MPVIYSDTRQHAGKHQAKEEWFAAHGVELVRRKLDFGDYMSDGSNISVDTKANVGEIAGNISAEHKRFRAECERARDAGCRLVVLIENELGYGCIADVGAWTNTHCAKCNVRRNRGCDPDAAGRCPRHNTRGKPIQGHRLALAMSTMARKYGVRFMFCDPKDSARIICELLGVEHE